MNVVTIRQQNVEQGIDVEIAALWTKARTLTENMAKNAYYLTLMPSKSKFDECTVSGPYPEPEIQTELTVHDDITDVAFTVELHIGVQEVY